MKNKPRAAFNSWHEDEGPVVDFCEFQISLVYTVRLSQKKVFFLSLTYNKCDIHKKLPIIKSTVSCNNYFIILFIIVLKLYS